MNLVEQIKHQLSSGVINQLSSLMGASEGRPDPRSMPPCPPSSAALYEHRFQAAGGPRNSSGPWASSAGVGGEPREKMSNQPGVVLEQGADMLNSLFGGRAHLRDRQRPVPISGIAPGATQKLLGYLTPLVMGSIAWKFAGKAPNAQGLASLLVDQKANIATPYLPASRSATCRGWAPRGRRLGRPPRGAGGEFLINAMAAAVTGARRSWGSYCGGSPMSASHPSTPVSQVPPLSPGAAPIPPACRLPTPSRPRFEWHSVKPNILGFKVLRRKTPAHLLNN